MFTRLRRLAALVAGVTILGLAATAWLHVIGTLENRSPGFIPTLTFVFPFWLLWALFAPFVVGLTRRYPIDRGHLVMRSGLHLGSAIAISACNTALRFALQPGVQESLRSGSDVQSTGSLLLALATLELPVHVFLYTVILGVTHVVLYYHRLRERELAATRLRAELADARMRALRTQLNPHFLFNALNSVAMLVRDARRDAAIETLEGLSSLLRHVLEERPGQEVELREEIAFVEGYTSIEKVRFKDRLEVEIAVSHEALDALVPSLVLQPLVENAIRHGVAADSGTVTVSVVARREGDTLLIRILDDGPGFRGARSGHEGTGLGIGNTRRRLSELYGDTASLVTEDRAPHGAAVTITLPFRAASTGMPEVP